MLEYIGIDLGGTNIRVGAMDENENIIFEYKEPTFNGVSSADELYNKIVNMIKKVPNYKDAKGIGIGVPGSVDLNSKRIVTCRNISIFKDYPLKEKLSKEFNKNIYIENDAKVACLAEAIAGIGKDKNIVCYITVSTGLGGGVAINKNIYHGFSNLGGYLSRVILDGKNTSDSLISGTAICKKAKEKIDSNIETTKEVFELYKNGDEMAKEIVEEFKHNLMILLLNISAMINPDIIVFGGGVMKSKEYFLEDVKEAFIKNAHPLAQNTIIDIAKFDEPGIIGACLLAKSNNLQNS